MSNTNIDFNLYDRQIRTIGIEAVKLIASSEVTIIGLEGGLATELCKNLALFGVKNINLLNDGEITSDDLENGYYYCLENVGKPKNEILNGLQPAIDEFLSINKSWILDKQYKNNNGLTILKKIA